MTGPRTLRSRLALLALAVTAAWVVVLTVGFNVILGLRLGALADDVLRSRAEAVLSTVDVAADGSLALRDPIDDGAIDAGIWIYRGRTAVVRPSASGLLQSRADALAGIGERFDENEEPGAVRLYALPIRSGPSQVGTVVTSLSLDSYQRTEEVALLGSVGLGLLLLAAGFLVTRTSVARALLPVATMTEQAAHWSASEVDRRFGPARRPQELDLLALTLDGLLDRLSAVLRHEQRLSAELSHELRTPLSRIVAESELAQRPGRSRHEMALALAAVQHSADQMTGILETLLSAERSRGQALPGRCEVLPAVLRAVEATVPAAADHGVRVDVAGDARLVAGMDGQLLERVVAPLVDNARRFAASHVAVVVAEGPRVTVSDDGPGVDGDLGDPFLPGRRSEADGHRGAGLGLALSRRLARAAGGDVELVAGGPGATFVVVLPGG